MLAVNQELTQCTETWEMTNLHAVATALSVAALTREETRGSHWREDFEETSDAWLRRVLIRADAFGMLSVTFEPVVQVPDTREVL